MTGGLRLGIGTPSVLDALALVHAGGRSARPVLERAYNICCDLGLVASTLARGGLAAVEQIEVRPGNPVRVMLAQRLSDAPEILAKLGGECAAEYKYDGVRVQAHRTADGRIELFTRRLERISNQFPDVVEALQEGLAPREAILEGEVVALTRPPGAAPVSGGHVPATQTRHRPGRAGRAGKPVLLRVAVRRRPGPHPTAVPATAGLLAEAITPRPISGSPPPPTSAPQPRWTRPSSRRSPTAARDCCASPSAQPPYTRPARGWLWIKLKRDYRTELADTVDLVVVGAFAGRGRRRGLYGALLLAAYDPAADTFRTVGKCGTGFSDAEMAALPDRLAPLARSERPARVDARQPADVWFEPSLVLEVLSAELTLSPTTPPAGDKSNPTRGWQCGSRGSPDAGATTKPPWTPPPPRNSSTCTAPHGEHQQAVDRRTAQLLSACSRLEKN